jgi:hypothetical protein
MEKGRESVWSAVGSKLSGDRIGKRECKWRLSSVSIKKGMREWLTECKTN